MSANWTRIGALLAATGVGLGAFGAHGLRERLGVDGREIWQTAVLYHLLHAVAIVAVARGSGERPTTVACAAFLIGVLAFSGSLYALALGGPSWLGPVTPIGGAAFLVGWVALAIRGARW